MDISHNGIILLLLSIMFSGYIHSLACISSPFLIFPDNTPLYGHITFYLFVSG